MDDSRICFRCFICILLIRSKHCLCSNLFYDHQYRSSGRIDFTAGKRHTRWSQLPKFFIMLYGPVREQSLLLSVAFWGKQCTQLRNSNCSTDPMGNFFDICTVSSRTADAFIQTKALETTPHRIGLSNDTCGLRFG